MTIKKKLIGIIIIFVLSIFCVGIFSAISLLNIVKLDDELKVKMDMQKISTYIQFRLAGISNDERALIITDKKDYATEEKQKIAEVQKLLHNLESLALDSKQKEMIDQLKQGFIEYSNQNEKVLSAYETNMDEAKVIHFGEERKIRKEVLDPAVNDFVSYLDKDVSSLKEKLNQSAQYSKYIILSVTLIASIVGCFLGFLLLRTIMKPLNVLNKQMKAISEGEADLTKKIDIQYNDEFGTLAQSFNRFLTSLHDIVRQIQTSSEQLTASSEEFSASAIESKGASEQISSSMLDISSIAQHQTSEISNSVLAVNKSLKDIQTITSNTLEVAKVTLDVKDQAENGGQSVTKLVRSMQTIQHSVDGASKGIHLLADTASEIDSITQMINDIAEQTNLLALNAAIEAARAGEHGKGFAVVAEEVRKLAEQSSTSANQIRNLIITIQTETASTVQSIDAVHDHVASGTHISNETATQFNQILSSIDKVTSQIQEIAATSQQLTSDFEHVSSSIEVISDEVKKSSEHTNAVASSSEEQLASMEEILNTAQALTRLAEGLHGMISRFKIS